MEIGNAKWHGTSQIDYEVSSVHYEVGLVHYEVGLFHYEVGPVYYEVGLIIDKRYCIVYLWWHGTYRPR